MESVTHDKKDDGLRWLLPLTHLSWGLFSWPRPNPPARGAPPWTPMVRFPIPDVTRQLLWWLYCKAHSDSRGLLPSSFWLFPPYPLFGWSCYIPAFASQTRPARLPEAPFPSPPNCFWWFRGRPRHIIQVSFSPLSTQLLGLSPPLPLWSHSIWFEIRGPLSSFR